MDFSTETKPEKAGQHFNADVMVESGQFILVVRENLTSFTDCLVIRNQTKPILKEGLIVLTSRLRLGNIVYVRVDGQSSLASLKVDKSLEPLGIFLTVGRPKKINKNATVDKAIRELREQLVRLQPQGGPYSQSILAQAVYFLNSLIRHSGRSAREIWSSRDQQTGANINLQDSLLSDIQFHNRQKSHNSSAQYASRDGKRVDNPNLTVGDTVFIKSDLSKSKARDSYFVLETDDVKKLAKLQKFPMSHFKHHPIIVEYQNLFKLPVVSPRLPRAPKLDPVLGSRDTFVSTPTSLSNPPCLTPNLDDDNSSSCTESDIENCSDDDVYSNCDNYSDRDDISTQEDYSTVNSDLRSISSSEDIHLLRTGTPPPEEHPLAVLEPQPPSVQIYLRQPHFGQPNYLKVGETVLLVQGDTWQKVILHSHSGVSDAQAGSLYWNYSLEDGSNLTGGYLFPGESWGVLRGEEKDLDISLAEIIIPTLSDTPDKD